MIDIAVHYLNYKPQDFFDLFLKSSYSKRIESGDPFVIWGKSGTELAFEIAQVDIGKYKSKLESNGLILHRSPEYWAGWSVAYYQWKTGNSFNSINSKIPFENIISLYNPYHEMDVLHFVDKLNSIISPKSQTQSAISSRYNQ